MKTISRSKRTPYSRSFIATAAIGLLMLAIPMSAFSLCASTAKELHDDLVAASDNGMYAGQDVEIDLVAGTYKTGAVTGNGPFTYSSTGAGHLILSGGWAANCAGFLRDATATVLDGRNLTQVLNIQNKNAEVFIEFLTIQNGESTVAGGGAAINTVVTGASAYIYDSIFLNNHTTSIGGGFALDGAGSQVGAHGNLIVGNSADGGYGAGFVYSRSGNQTFLDQSTVYKNTTIASGGTGGMYCCGTPVSDSEVRANIFWQNTNFGIDVETAGVDFEYNDYGTVKGIASPDSTNLSTDPKFIDADNGNYRLSGVSPLLGVWPADSFTSTDLAGDPYPFPANGYFDIGAYEDTVFTDRGFENN